MPPFYELSVARFVRASPSSSPTSSQWTIAVTFTSNSASSLIYQITPTPSASSSSHSYTLAAPASVTLELNPRTPNPAAPGLLYAGRAKVGLVDSECLHTLHATLVKIRLVRGNPEWGTREWVMECVDALRSVPGFHVDKDVSLHSVAEKLGEK